MAHGDHTVRLLQGGGGGREGEGRGGGREGKKAANLAWDLAFVGGFRGFPSG